MTQTHMILSTICEYKKSYKSPLHNKQLSCYRSYCLTLIVSASAIWS